MWSRHLILQDLHIKLVQFIQVLQTILHNKKYVITWNMNPVNQLLFNRDPCKNFSYTNKSWFTVYDILHVVFLRLLVLFKIIFGLSTLI